MIISPSSAARLRAAHIHIVPGLHDFREDFELFGPCHFGLGIENKQLDNIGAFTYSITRINSTIRKIGRYCSIASGITFGEMEHAVNWLSTSSFVYDSNFIWGEYSQEHQSEFTTGPLDGEKKRGPITIGDDVWLGARCYIRGGITIGTGAIVGTEAVVTKDVPPFAVVVGNPARIVKYRFSDQTIARLLALKWWDYDFVRFKDVQASDVHQALDTLERMIEAGEIRPHNPTPIRLIDYVDR